MQLQKTWACLLLITLIISPHSLANATLNDSVNDMFNRWGGRVNITSPGAYDAQTRGFIVGGSLSARVPQTTIHPFNLKPPSIKAGCGGIDIFGGSFSFINADQFTQFLQQIGQNALGYAFSLGLEAVCPTCNSVIKWLRQQMDMLNKFNMDSCMAAKALVNTAGEAAGAWSLEKCKQTKGGGDPVTGWLECASGNEATIRSQLRDVANTRTADAATAKTKDSPRGATTAQALQWTSLTVDQRQQVVSMLGTWHTKDDDDTGDCSFQSPTLSLADLVQGGTVTLLKCGSGGFGDGQTCEDVTTEDVEIEGFAKLVRDKMQGIVASYKNKVALTEEQIAFVNAIPVPPVAYMLKNSLVYSEELANSLIDLTSEASAASMAWQMIDYYLRVFQNGSANASACNLEYKEISNQIREIRASRQELYDKYMKGFNAQVAIIQMMASIDAKVAASASQKILNALSYGNKT